MSRSGLMKLFFPYLLLAFVARAGEPYAIHPLSEPETLNLYVEVLRDACRHAERDWHDASSSDPKAGRWGDGASSGNQGIRAVAGMLLASATLIKYDDGLTDDERGQLLAKAVAALRYVTATHNTGTLKCADGKAWGATAKFGGESWQSGMWTGTLAFGAWLIWDRLDESLRRDFERVIAWEDDILAGRKPPNGLWADTKAEENGWEVPCLVLGELMFPGHPHAGLWHETAVRYMMNTLCTEADTRDLRVVDGALVSNWVFGANLQPDFTLENHNRFHPSYVACSSYFLTQAVMYYTFAGRPVPQSATHHVLDTWGMFQTMLLPWGESVYPQGMDWELHALPYLNLFAALGTHGQDPYAAHLEQSELQYLRAWQTMGQGSLETPGSTLGFTRHAINAEQAAYGFLAHKIFRPAVPPLDSLAAARQEQGVRFYPYVGFATHRTQRKVVTFSWRNQIMGQLIPIGDGHEGNPDFTVPIPNGWVGSFELEPRGEVRPIVADHNETQTSDGFVARADLVLNGGRLRQTIRVTSAGEQIAVYEDVVTAQTDVTIKSELGVPLGIENDAINGGRRTVFDRAGKTELEWPKTRPPLVLSGSWANVDGRLGIAMVKGGNLAYVQAAKATRGISVYADILYGARAEEVRHFKAGEEAAHRLAILVAEASPEETAALAASARIETSAGAPVLRFTSPEGAEMQIPLLR